MSLFESLENRQHFAFGTVVTAYGTGGLAAAPLESYSSSPLEAAVAVDGKTTVGTAGGLARFNANGALDSTFGNGGLSALRRVSYLDHAIDASGRVYVLATASSGTVVQRYTAAGRLDSGFGTSGTALVESSKAFFGVALDVQTDGKIVVAGNYRPENATSLTTRTYRLTAGGALDASFANDGSADFKLGISDLLLPDVYDGVADVRVLSGGKIAVLGRSNSMSDDGQDAGLAALARLNANGTLDTGFGSGGVARRATFDNVAINLGVGAIRADGSAVIATTTSNDERTSFVGFTASGKTAFNTYSTGNIKYKSVADATGLADGRTAFVTGDGRTFAVGTDGSIGVDLQPRAAESAGTRAIAATPDGDFLVLNIKAPNVSVVKVDAGRPTDARPDNLPASGALDTAVDSFGGLHVAFFDAKTKTLKYAYRNPQGYWGGIRTVDATVGAGAAISIDTYNNKGRTNVAIAYYDASAADLRLAASSTNGRKFQFNTIANRGYVGTSPSFHYTDNGGYAVSYYSKSTKSLYYALNTGSGFVTELVDSKGSGEWSELQFDPATRRPAIAYSSSGNTVKYALKDKVAGWANPTVVATTASGAGFVNLAIPYDVASYGGPKISYYDLASADLVIATFDRYAAKAKRWSTHIVASRGVVGAFNDIISPYSTPRLYAYSRSGDGVFAYDYNPATQTATATAAVLGGGRNLSLAVDRSNNVAALAYLDTKSGLTFVR